MKFHPQLRTLVLSVGMALAAGPAVAGSWGAASEGDSGMDVNTVLGNSFSPSGVNATAARDSDGLGPYRSPAAHSPSGQLYSVPYALPSGDSALNASVEFGYLSVGGEDNAQKFREYTDFRDGLLINSFSVDAAGKDHTYLNVYGGSVGRSDQYYGAAVGRYNDWRVRAFYNETPHLFSTSGRPIWDGVGTDHLTLKQPLGAITSQTGYVVDATTKAMVEGVINNTKDTDIGLTRKKTGLRFDKNLGESLNFFVNANVETRKGARPFGLAPNGPGGAAANPTTAVAPAANGPLDPAEPINYTTTEIQAGFGWVIDDLSTLTARIEASLFRDGYKFVTVEDPYFAPCNSAVGGVAACVGSNKHTLSFSTPPSNEQYTVKVGYARSFPDLWKSDLSVNVSLGRQNQNDTLVPYTSVTGNVNNGANLNLQGTGVNQADARFWNALISPINGVQTVTRLTSGLHNDITMINLGWNMRPTDDLSLNAKVRTYRKIDTNTYMSCNPALAAALNASGNVTGRVDCDPALSTGTINTAAGALPTIYGYAGEDGQGLGLGTKYVIGTGGQNRAKSFNGSFKQNNFSLGGDYQVNKDISVNASFEREDVWRPMRERTWTNENMFKVGIADRNLWNGTLRASYEYDHRTGDDWSPFGYIEACAAWDIPSQRAACWANVSGASPNGVALTPAQLTANVVAQINARPPEGQKHDLADRDRKTLVVRYNTMLTSTLDAMVTARTNHERFPDKSQIQSGRDVNNDDTISLDLNWLPSTDTNVYGTLTWQQSKLVANALRTAAGGSTCTLATLIAGGCNALLGTAGNPVANSTYGASANGTDYQYSEQKDDNKQFMLGVTHKLSSVTLDGTYSYLRTRTSTKYGIMNYVAATNSFAYDAVNGATDGSLYQLPDNVYDRQTLTLSATVPLDSKLSIRGSYMYDRVEFADWHYSSTNPSVPSSAASGNRIFLDTGAQQPYSAHAAGLYLQYKM